MSAVHERGALEPPVSLFDHAQRLRGLYPDGPLPRGGRPFPDESSARQRREALRSLLRDFIADPALTAQDLHDRCTRLVFDDKDVRVVVYRLRPEPSPRLMQAARKLIRNGTDRRAVLVGLGLLHRHADLDDVPMVKLVGLLEFATVQAGFVLFAIPGARQDFYWLLGQSPGARDNVREAMAEDLDPTVLDWASSSQRSWTDTSIPRNIAEGHGLRAMLERPDVNDVVWEQAGNLLFAMSNTDLSPSLGEYPDATAVCRRWVALAEDRPATVDRAVLLVLIAEELATGYAALVVGDLRDGLVSRISGVLAAWTGWLQQAARGHDPVEARRAAWVIRQAAGLGVPPNRFAVRVVPHDPNPISNPVETRIVIDGRPIFAEVFRGGWPDPPEWLIHEGKLRATSEPKEILLYERETSKLYVTIVREGEQVIWRDWRCVHIRAELPGEVRFDAGQYDREVARAEQDHSWEWPARTVARLVDDRLREDPAILGQWNCDHHKCRNSSENFDRAVLAFGYPAERNSIGDPSVTFHLAIEVGDRAAEVVADEVIASLRDTDPKDIATMHTSHKDIAETFGLTYRPYTDWPV